MSQPTPLPQSLGNRYEFGDLIGTGGMGAVYLGRDMLTGQNVAIKLLKPEIIEAEPSMVERFAREADALRQLNHPNIVKVLGTYEEEDKHFIVMEYVGGGTLADLLHQVNPLPIKQVLEISLELADALSRAHHLKIIHRDIKPANVLLAIDGTPRLTDFGVAYLETKDRMTRTGTSLGTLDYLSPEAIDGEAVDTRADIWAFGVMLYEMLAGARPFTGQSVTQMLAAILTQTPPDLKTVRPDIPESLAELVTDMLEKDRNQRTASARMVGAALEAVLRGDSTPSRSRFPTPAITPKPAPRNRLFIMVGAAAIVLLGVIGFLILNGGNGQDEATDNDIASLATPAPEATASSAITQTLPDGWIRYTQDSFSIAVPSGWTNVGSGDAMDTYFNLLAPIAGANPGMSGFVDVLRPMIENGAIRLVLSDLTNFSNVVVMAEPIGFTLTPELVRLRVEAFFSSLELLEPIEFTTVQLPAGDAQVFTGQIQMGDMIGDGAGYLFIKDSILYWVLFPFAHSDITNLETMTPLIDQIMQSFTFEEATPEATPEAAASTVVVQVPIPATVARSSIPTPLPILPPSNTSSRAFIFVGSGGTFTQQGVSPLGDQEIRLIARNPVDPSQFLLTDGSGNLYQSSGAGVSRVDESPFSQFPAQSPQENNAFVSYITWSPDGQYVAFVVDGNDNANDGVWYYAPGRFPPIQLLVDCGFEGDVACDIETNRQFRSESVSIDWSPGSDALLVRARLVESDGRGALFVLPRTEDRNFYNTVPPALGYDFASWSPDGSRIIVSGRRPDGLVIIGSINRDGSDERIIFNASAAGLWIQSAVQRPDGSVYALGNPNGSTSPLRLYNQNGVALTGDLGGAVPGRILWSPDGGAVLVVIGNQVLLARVDGTVTDVSASVAGSGGVGALSWASGAIAGGTPVGTNPGAPSSGLPPGFVPPGVIEGSRYQPGQQLRVFVPELNIRVSPTTNAEIINVIPYGNYVVILAGPANADDVEWWEIQTADGTVGWIAGVIQGLDTLGS